MSKVAIFQEVIPSYRRGFFRQLINESNHWIRIVVNGARRTAGDGGGLGNLERLSQGRQLRVRLPLMARTVKMDTWAVYCLWNGDYDVMVLPNDILSLHVWICCVLRRWFKPRVCLWGHGFSRPDTEFCIWLRLILMSLADAAIFYDERTRQKWLRRGLPVQKLYVAPNALDTGEIGKIIGQLTADDISQFNVRNHLQSKKILLFCGGLCLRKRVDVLIKAMPLILSRVPEAHVLIVGDGPLARVLNELTSDLGLNSAVTFCGEILCESTLARLFMSSQVTVIPAAAGLLIQHAFGYGIPVVVGDDFKTHGPEISLVKSNETGLFFRAGDSASLANQVWRLLENEPLRGRLGRNAMRLIAEQHNLGRMVSGFLEALDYCQQLEHKGG